MGFAQVKINGKVTDQTEVAQPYVNVLLLLSIDSSLVKGTVSNDEGQFFIENVIPGEYIIATSMVGFETNYTTPFAVNQTQEYDIGQVKLKEAGTALQQVEVNAKKPLYEQQIDRMIINVQNSITFAGGNAYEVLARSPGININEQNNTLSMNGKQGVQIMIDGKTNRMPLNTLLDMLRGMDANNIEKIELFAIPPAHFDAEGDAGVINIIMKLNKAFGTNGSFSLNAGYGKRFKYGGNVNLNYRKNKLNLFSTYAFSHRYLEQIYTFHRVVKQGNQLITTDSENKRKPIAIRNNLRLGLDYDLSAKTVFGILLSGYASDYDTPSFNNSSFSDVNGVYEIIKNKSKESSKWKHGMVNANIQHHFQKNESISFDVDYFYYKNENPSNYFIDFFNGENNLLETSQIQIKKESPITNRSFKIDYQKTINDKIGLQLGIKGTSSRFGNDINVEDLINNIFVKNEEFSQLYNLEENIAAAYTSLDIPLNNKTKMILGLRYEYTDNLLSTQDDPKFLDQNYGNFFPSFFISHQLNEHNRIQFSYSRRISRPAFNELAPFVTFIDPNTFFTGNPGLQPGISNNMKTDYRFKKINFSFHYGYTENAIVSYQPVIEPETNRQRYTTLNLDKQHTTGISIALPLYLTDWWEVQNTAFGDWEKIVIQKDGAAAELKTSSFSVYMVHSFNLPDNFALEIAGRYQSPAFYGLLKVQSKGFVNVGLQKKLAEGKGIFRLNVSDIFRTNIWRSTTNIPNLDLNNTSVIDVETRIVRLTYSRNFGNGKVKKARSRSTSSEEERRRVR